MVLMMMMMMVVVVCRYRRFRFVAKGWMICDWVRVCIGGNETMISNRVLL